MREEARAARDDGAGDLLGIVLAGGGSRRFGSAKALARFGGEALWQRATRALGEAGLPTLVIANDPDVSAAAGKEGGVRRDLRPGEGPLAGVETGLAEARALGSEGILVLACDMVLVDPRLLGALVDIWPGRGAAAFEAPGPWGVAPLCSIWGVDLLPRVSGALDAGQGSVGELLLDIPHVVADPRRVLPGVDPAEVFRSANRPGDLAELEAKGRGS